MAAIITRGEISKPVCIDYAVAAQPLAGESISGDAHFVKQFNGEVLLGVIDGIGHGREAASAASAAIAVLENHWDEPLVQLIQRCHRELINGRGVAMTVISIQPDVNEASWLGVGNVWGGLFVTEAHATRRWKSLQLHGGIVGYYLPRLQSRGMAIASGDWLVLATDGVRPDFSSEFAMNGSPQEVATRILSRYFRGNDDALVLTARYRREGA